MTARKIGLLLLILVVGGIVDASWMVRERVGVGASGCRVMRGRFYGPSFTFDVEEARPLGAGATVEVANAFGAVRVIQGQPSALRVSLRKVVYQPSEDRARAFADRVRLQWDGPLPAAAPAGAASPAPAGPAAIVRLTTNREELERGQPEVGFETHLELSVPAGTSVVVRNEHGRVEVADVAAADVTGSFEPMRLERVAGRAQVRARHADVHVSGVAGALSLSARHGLARVEDVQGACTAEVEHGDASFQRVGPLSLQAAHGDVTVQAVRGDLEVRAVHTAISADEVQGQARVETSYRDVQVRRVTGEARLKADHGNIEASDVEGPLSAEASFDDVVLERVGGPVDVRVAHGGVRATGLRKGGRITASGEAVTVERFGGPLEVETQRADVELQPAQALTDALLARTSFGDIRLHVPEGSRMSLEAATPRGELTVDVPGLSLTRESGGHATGRLGGGTNQVRLVADHGDVHVASSIGAVAEAPARDRPN